MRFRLAFTVFFVLSAATLLFGQKKPYLIEFQRGVANRNEMPFNITAVADLSKTQNVIGVAHTGMMNKAKAAGLRYGTEGGLLYIVKPSMDKVKESMPTATLNVLFLRISETILAMKETGRIEMAATLSVETPEGTRHYGPAQFQQTTGGMDATAKHDDNILEAGEVILAELREAYEAGRTIDAPLPTYRPLEGEIGNGAYYTVLDFQLARTDPDFGLVQTKLRQIDTYKGRELAIANFERSADLRKKDADDLYGYHYNGRSFVFVKGRFYEVIRTDDGKIRATLPNDLYRSINESQAWGYAIGGLLGGALASSGDNPNELIPYEMDVRTGKFEALGASGEEPEVSWQEESVDLGVYLVHTGEQGSAPIAVEAEGKRIELAAGEMCKFAGATVITYSSKGNSDSEILKMYADRPIEVYSIERKKNKKIEVKWVATDRRPEMLKSSVLVE